jgi:hypothetical protein
VRKIGNFDYRLEVTQPPSKDYPYWRLDFCKLRFDGGPGKAKRNTPTKSFDLEDDEGFAEETAMLFEPTTGYMIAQYNHHGPRSATIEEYLSIYDSEMPNHYQLNIQLKHDAQARLAEKKLFSRLLLKVAPARLTEHYKHANVALTTLLNRHQEEFGGDYVSITIGLEHHSHTPLKLKGWIKSFLQLANETEAVDALQISGRPREGERTELIDLIKEKLEVTLTDIDMDAGLRYVREDRWRALARAYNAWKNDYLT